MKSKKTMTFTKIMVSVILFVSLLDVQFVFVLALLGKMQIAETLGVAIVTELIATILGYLCKSFFENREIGKNEIENKKINMNYSEMLNKDSDFKVVDINNDVMG